MNPLHDQKVCGGVVDEDGRPQVVRQLIGGPCRTCGRTRGNTVFCPTCGANVCWQCFYGARCDVTAPDGFAWSHARATRVRIEARENRKAVLASARAEDKNATSFARQLVAEGPPSGGDEDGEGAGVEGGSQERESILAACRVPKTGR